MTDENIFEDPVEEMFNNIYKIKQEGDVEIKTFNLNKKYINGNEARELFLKILNGPELNNKCEVIGPGNGKIKVNLLAKYTKELHDNIKKNNLSNKINMLTVGGVAILTILLAAFKLVFKNLDDKILNEFKKSFSIIQNFKLSDIAVLIFILLVILIIFSMSSFLMIGAGFSLLYLKEEWTCGFKNKVLGVLLSLAVLISLLIFLYLSNQTIKVFPSELKIYFAINLVISFIIGLIINLNHHNLMFSKVKYNWFLLDNILIELSK